MSKRRGWVEVAQCTHEGREGEEEVEEREVESGMRGEERGFQFQLVVVLMVLVDDSLWLRDECDVTDG